MDMYEEAAANLAVLKACPYPGTGFLIGEKDGNAVQVLWLQSRNVSGQNRVLVSDSTGRLVRTEIADRSRLMNPMHTIYVAMCEARALIRDATDIRPVFIVGNGAQTDKLVMALNQMRTFSEWMDLWPYQRDEKFTSLITGMASWASRGLRIQMSIMRKSPRSNACNQSLYGKNDLVDGFGYCMTTYANICTGEDPLPPFQGEPYLLPIKGNIDQVLDCYREALDGPNLVALAVRFIPRAEHASSKIRIYNKCQVV